MPEQNTITGTVTALKGADFIDIKLQIFDRDLPSLERRTPARLAPIGEALVEMTESGHGQAIGHFQITYTLEVFQEGEAVSRDHPEGKKHADLSFRVLDANNRPLRIASIKALGREYSGDAILFNVPDSLEVEIAVEASQEQAGPPVGDSEYEQLVARVTPVIDDLPLANLTNEDLTFLIHELGFEQDQNQQQRLHWLHRATQLGRETHLPPEMFYGWGRKDVPSPFGELAGLDQNQFLSILQKLLSFADDELQRTVHLAASEKIIPQTAFEDIRLVRALLQAALQRLQGLDDEDISVPQVSGRLLDRRRLSPLARYTVEAKLLLKTGEEASLGTTLSNAEGQFAFMDKRLSQPIAQDHSSVRLGLRILNAENKALLKTEISAVLDGEAVPIYVPSEEDEPVPVPKLDALAALGGPQLPQELLAFLQAQGITSLEDVWKTGQVATLNDIPQQHRPAAQTLDAHANLFRLSPDVKANAALIEKGFTSTVKIADMPEDLFIQQTRSTLGDVGALALHGAAQTERKVLHHIFTDVRIKESMGFDLSDIIPGFRPPRPRPQQCSCRQCETAASPLAYLVDLLSYALTHLRFGFDAGWASPITMEWLTNTFHQPFADLPVSCEAMDTKIRQVRLCVEVLRRYLKTQTVTPERLTRFKQAEQAYRLAAYTALLAQLGTTYEELRLSRDADQSKVRLPLAARLGFTLEAARPDRLDALLLDPASITEVDLEGLFGLMDTQMSRDRLSDGQVVDDSEQQVRRWNVTGIVWRRTTDDEGLIHVSLEQVGTSSVRVELFRNSGRTTESKVAEGEISALTGVVPLKAVGQSGLSGTMDLAYKTNSKKITLVGVPRILAWRLAHLRSVWAKQDRPTEVGAVLVPPRIDPDLVGLDDLRDPSSGSAAALWKARRDQVDGVIKELRDTRLAASSAADALSAVLQHSNGIQKTLDELKQFHAQREAGTDIRPSLAAIPLTIAQLEVLIRLGRLVSTSPAVPVLESEWSEVDAISAKVWKMRQAADWWAKEAEAGLTLGPDFFVIPESAPLQFPPAPPLTLLAWLATNDERREWERTLKARIDQEIDTITAHQQVVGEAEASTIADLRDALIDMLGDDRQQLATELTAKLLIDCADGTCHVTTRPAQALDTLQLLLFSCRNARLRSWYPTLNLAAPDFDDEWLWMGTYASWRAAQLTFLYCENLCHPTLRDRQSPGFRRLVQEARALPRMTPEQACKLVKDYNRYFSDVGQMKIEASVWAMTRVYQGTGCRDRRPVDDHRLLHLFGVPAGGQTLYWATFDPEPIGSDKLSFWDWVPALKTETINEVIGATTYTMQNGSRLLFVFVKAIRSGTQVLLFSRFDLERATWEINSFPLDMPERGRNFEAILLRNEETHPPVLTVRHRDATGGPGVPYTRSLNLDGNGWMEGEWFPQYFSPWMPVGMLPVEPGTKVAAVGRNPDRADIFTVRNDGGVYHAWRTSSIWSEWARLDTGFQVPVGSPITVLAHSDDSIELFVSHENGRIWARRGWVSASASPPPYWGDWIPIGGNERSFLPKTPIVAIDSDQYTLLFAFDQAVEIVSTRHRYLDYTAPLFDNWFRINIFQPPARISPLGVIVKRSNVPQAPFGLFYVHKDEGIYGTLWCGKDTGDFSSDSWYWVEDSSTGEAIYSEPQSRWPRYLDLTVTVDSPITGLSLPNLQNLFVVGKEGGVYQLRWEAANSDRFYALSGRPDKWNRVGQLSVPEKTPIAALSWTDNHMDLFVVAENQRIHHTWWDINANEGKWHDWTPISQPGVIFPKRTPITAVSPRPGHIDLFAVGGDGAVLASWWDSDPTAQWPTKPPMEIPRVDGKPVACNPIFGFPIDVSHQTSAEFLQIARGMIRNAYLDTVLPPDGSVGQQRSLDYLDEAYYFVAMYLAQLQQRDGYYIEALDAYRTVYDYTAPSGEWREIAYLLVQNKDWSKAYERSSDWLEDPLNPHRMAAARPGAYLFYTKMAIARCCVEAGNAQYTLYTPESLPVARTYYMTALEVLSDMRKDSNHPKCEVLIGEVNLQLGDGHYETVLKRDLAKLMHLNDRTTVEETVKKLKTLPIGRNSADERLQAARTIISEVTARPTPTRRIAETVQEARPLEGEIHSGLLSVPAVEQVARHAAQQVSMTVLSSTAETLGMTIGRMRHEKPALPWLKNGRRDVVKWTEAGSSSAHRLHNIGDPRVKQEMLLPPVFPQPIPTQVYIPPVSYRFCVPPNPILKGIILEAELNLYKLRRCRDIAGMERAVDLYSAPTDVETDLPTLDEDGQIALSLQSNVRPTNHHYAVLIARAKELAQMAAQFESTLLSMLEKGDAEAYNEQRARQDSELARAQVRIHDLQVVKDQNSLRLAQLQRERTEVELEHWQSLLDEGLSGLESAYSDAVHFAAAEATMKALVAAGAAAIPSINTLLSSGKDAYQLLGIAETTLLGVAEINSQLLSQQASWERRQQDWEHQRTLALVDVRISNQAITLAEIALRITQEQRRVAILGADYTAASLEFIRNKFTNVALYETASFWLEKTYRWFLSHATAIAQLARLELSFQLQDPSIPKIRSDYWEVPALTFGGASQDLKGITGSARLLQDIYALDQHAFEKNKRKLNLTKMLSIAQIAPLELQQFRQTGVLHFATTLDMFDRDFPGDYMRLIKRVGVILDGTGSGINATLSCTGVSRVVADRGPGQFDTVVLRRDPQRVALIKQDETTNIFRGVFASDSQPELLQPFEGLGVETSWELRILRASNTIDLSKLADIRMVLDYTSLHSETYAARVMDELGRTVSYDRPFSFQREFPTEWTNVFKDPSAGAPALTARIGTNAEHFYKNLTNLRIEQVTIQFALSDGPAINIVLEQLRLTPTGKGPVSGIGGTNNGVISSRLGNADFSALINQSPIGKWEISLPNTAQTRDWFKEQRITDIILIITYGGDLPAWPS